MSFPPVFNRRQFGALIAALLSSRARESRAGPKDNGIGGTGAVSAMPEAGDDDLDNGIGGTGVVGTIRDFGSIIVNDLRIAYPTNAEVTIDGAPADPSGMRIGHVVSLVAMRDGASLRTDTIHIRREVVGAIEAVSARHLRVLGQHVELRSAAKSARFVVGQHVAVSGLRLPDETIVASLVEPAEPSATQLAGTLIRAPDGALMIGGQRIVGIAGAMLGERLVLRGALEAGALRAGFVSTDAGLPHGPRRFVIETYLQRRGARVTTESGLAFGAAHNMSFQGVARGVVTLRAAPDGGWSVKSFRAMETLGARGAAPERVIAPAPPPAPATQPSGAGSNPGAPPPSGFGPSNLFERGFGGAPNFGPGVGPPHGPPGFPRGPGGGPRR